MKEKNTILELRYMNYINDITYKRINLIMIVSIIILLVLMFLDLRLRNNLTAVYTRIPSLFIAVFILILKNLKNKKNKLTYRSGGGITSKSNATFEYNEMLQKIYVPI
ncbi:MAG: chorismate-binding protein [Bacteroidales bacterium]|nr:chorismate-binding protein [Bacteroidales bacterium]